MNHFSYRNGVLHGEGVSLAAIADAVGTPFYCYSKATVLRHARVFAGSLPGGSLVAFSVKSNGNPVLLRLLAREGIGADIVSGGELKRALAAGIPAEKIVFSGVGKTRAELEAALAAGIYQFNVESEPELVALDAAARAMGKTAPVAIRVNPDVDAHTHAKISTGHAETKFGIPWKHAREAYRLAAGLTGIAVKGIDVHIGSQISELGPFEAAFSRVTELLQVLRADGHTLDRLDFGGGLGVPYRQSNTPPPEPDAYGAVASAATKGLGVQLIFEPGRLIVANAGVLVATTTYVKLGEDRQFVILDAGMNDLIRPALYDAYHDIVPLAEPPAGAPHARYDVVGPICETADRFAENRDLPCVEAGDRMAILTAGAYGAVMASAYNARPLAPEVLVDGDRWAVVRPKLDDDALYPKTPLPDWL